MAGTCSICNVEASKYKCSTCRIDYCSVACYKKHKETPCVAPASASKPAAPLPEDLKWQLSRKGKYDDEEEEEASLTRLDLAQLQNLGEDASVRSFLHATPIRQYIQAIEQSRTPDKLLATYRKQDDQFEAFVQALLNATKQNE
ncbi:hypothetical protein BC940DRAFT_302495 [Gongronella butleri]|nr:hypothetical protein BC940DRAFT_302495 [Gongronella butleri]